MDKSNLTTLKDKCLYSAGIEISDAKLEKLIDEFSKKEKGSSLTLNHEDNNFKIGAKYNIEANFYKVDEEKVMLSGIKVENKENPQLSQYFSHTQDNLGITAKEGINLLEGRSVYKEQNVWKDGKPTDEVKAGWYELDTSKKNEKNQFEYNRVDAKSFDLPARLALSGVNMVEGEKLDLSKLMRSLEKGNVPRAFVSENEKTREIRIAANPQYKNFSMNYADDGKIYKTKINGNTVDYLRNNNDMADRVIAASKPPQLKELKEAVWATGDDKLKPVADKIEQKLQEIKKEEKKKSKVKV